MGSPPLSICRKEAANYNYFNCQGYADRPAERRRADVMKKTQFFAVVTKNESGMYKLNGIEYSNKDAAWKAYNSLTDEQRSKLNKELQQAIEAREGAEKLSELNTKIEEDKTNGTNDTTPIVPKEKKASKATKASHTFSRLDVWRKLKGETSSICGAINILDSFREIAEIDLLFAGCTKNEVKLLSSKIAEDMGIGKEIQGARGAYNRKASPWLIYNWLYKNEGKVAGMVAAAKVAKA